MSNDQFPIRNSNQMQQPVRTMSELRPTIGLLIPNIASEGGYEPVLWAGVVEACQKRDVNLICFTGGSLRFSSIDEFENQRNAVYDLVTPDNVDGLIIVGSLGNLVPPEAFRNFYDRYRPLPMVSIALTQEGIPSILVDNYGGMRNAIAHLTQTHGYRRIAFIRGPEGSQDAEERYRAYTDVLAEYGLTLNPDLVAPGNFVPHSGKEAVRLLLDQRQVDFEAIVAADDNMAIGAMEELEKRGIRVPYEVSVLGFDDIEDAGTVIPSLTTVRQPMAELGKRATEMLFALLIGESTSEQVVVPTRLVVRQSCGCLSPAVTQAAVAQIPEMHESFETVLSTQREDILFKMVQAVGDTFTNTVTEQAEQLLDAFSAELGDGSRRDGSRRDGSQRDGSQRDGSPNTFLSALDTILRQVVVEDGNVASWYGALSALRHYVRPYLSTDNESLLRLEDTCQQARVLIGETIQRAQMNHRKRMSKQTQMLYQVGQTLITAFDMASLTDSVVRLLPQLGIPRCYLSLYEGRGAPTEKSRLALAYDEHGIIELEDDSRVFFSRQLAPAGFLRREKSARRYTMVVEPLYLKDNSLGFALFEAGAQNEQIYETLRGHLSSALKGALLVQEVEERTRALQDANYAIQRRAMHLEASAEVGRAITSIFDMDELLRKAVHLIRDQFGWYHAGIFLLDEAAEWAVLQEATGEAGAQMKAQGHRLAVGETSMVGWTVLHREPRIAQYVSDDEVRFAHPLLPYTRSEMTLPMMIGGRSLGVLNVQSTDEAAFDDDDVRALQSMANQVAVAIENARQVSHEARLLEATSPIYRISRQLAQVTTTGQVADAIITSVAEMGADGCLVVEFAFSSEGEPEALLYRGVWRKHRDVQFQPGMRLPMSESPFPFEMVSTLWTVPDVEQDTSLPRSARQVFLDTDVMALANIPLRARDKVIGQVVVLRNTTGPVSDAAIRLYEALSDQAAVALERAQLWEEAQRRAERERLMSELSEQMQRASDMETLMRITAEGLTQALGGSRVFVHMGTEAELTAEIEPQSIEGAQV